MANPQTAQGTLNRILTQVTIASYPGLNISSSYMGKSFAVLSFNDSFTTQIPTATGVVNSPEPYVMASLTVGLLRTQSLAASWLSQVQAGTVLGSITGYPDSTVFPAVTLSQCAVTAIDPGAWDGTDPVVKVTISGVFPVNSNLWG